MQAYLWIQFPAKYSCDPADPGDVEASGFKDAGILMPPPLPPPSETETEIKLECTIRLSKAEGPIASQAGTLLDVLAAMLKDHNAPNGLLWASWEEPAWISDWPK